MNVHFEDELRDGELIFDYRMKPGPVTHSNALALMKAVGLPVQHHWQIGRSVDWKTSIPLARLSQIFQSSNLPIYQSYNLRTSACCVLTVHFANGGHAVPKSEAAQIGNVVADRDAARIAGRAVAQFPGSAIDLDAADAIARDPGWPRCSARCERRRGNSCDRTAPAATGGCCALPRGLPQTPPRLLLPRANPTARIEEMRSFHPSDRRSSIVP